MSDNRATQIGKQVVWGIGPDNNVTQIGKQVAFPVINDGNVTIIGKQVVWSSNETGGGTGGGGNPVPPQAAPAALIGRGGTLYVDSALEYDGRNAGASDGLHPGVTLAFSGGSTWLPGEILTLTASANTFISGDVGNVLVLHETDSITGATLSTTRFTIGVFTSATVVTGVADIAIPTAIRSADITVWDRLVDAVAGLDHLEGEAVGILGDEHVIASPNNARLPVITVTSGAVSLGDFYSRVIVGLPYLSDIETLDIDSPQGPSLKGQKIDISKLGFMVAQSRSIWGGGLPPTNDALNPLQDLQEVPLPTDDNYEKYLTQYIDANIISRWTDNGRVFIRSVDPVAANITSVVKHGFIPGPG